MLTHQAANLPLDPAIETEGQLESKLRLYAKGLGKLYYHTFNSKRSDPGYPDCSILDPQGGTLWVVELKSEDGVVSPAQRRWLEALSKVTRVETGVYKPSNITKLFNDLKVG